MVAFVVGIPAGVFVIVGASILAVVGAFWFTRNIPQPPPRIHPQRRRAKRR